MDRIRQAILDWVQHDAGVAIKMTITPDLVNKLRDRIVANTKDARPPAPSLEEKQEAADASDALSEFYAKGGKTLAQIKSELDQ